MTSPIAASRTSCAREIGGGGALGAPPAGLDPSFARAWTSVRARPPPRAPPLASSSREYTSGERIATVRDERGQIVEGACQSSSGCSRHEGM